MKREYKTKGVCSKKIHFELEEGIIRSLHFDGGCEGNLKGVSALALGRSGEEVAAVLAGLTCGGKKTSCPDQLSKALKKALAGSQKKTG